MKTKTLLFILLLFSAMVSAQVKRVAILETVDRENKVSYANKLILRANLSKAITQTSGYEAYDRTDVDAIMSEQDFQRTGLVSNDQIKRLGEMTGANYILVAEAVVVDAKNMFITAKLLDVETARTIMTDNVMMGTSADEIQKGCIELAKRLFYTMLSNNNPQSYNEKSQSSYTNTPPNMLMSRDATDYLIRNPRSEQKLLGMKEYSFGNIQMTENEFANFLRQNNYDAYKQYRKDLAMVKTGWAMLGCGIGVFTLGGCLLLVDWISPCILMPIGFGAMVSTIPLVYIGNTRKKSIEMFNEQLDKPQYRMSLNVQASQNGVGLALSF